MSFCQVHWSSQVLGKQTTTWVLLPDGGTPPFATFYLLHGLGDDQTMWMRRSRIEMHAAGLPLIIVMPDGGRGFYTNHQSGPQWAMHLAEELPPFIERTFPAQTDSQGRCIGGLSMGGYGALRLALGYPDRYVSANSHSGALMVGTKPPTEPERLPIFGPDPRGTEHDLTALAARAKSAGPLPRLRIDCGTDDFLLDDNRAFHRTLTELAVDHEYQEFSGGHSWDYWDLHVREALAFHAKATGT
jgi:S-formylglutathione hydrolase FrmB